MAVALARSPFMRGYFPLAGEVLDPALGGDWKEGFDMALDLPLDDPAVVARKPLHGPNQWPSRPPEFRRIVQRYFDDLVALGRTLSRGFALSLDLPEEFSRAHAAPDRDTASAALPAQSACRGDGNTQPGCGAPFRLRVPDDPGAGRGRRAAGSEPCRYVDRMRSRCPAPMSAISATMMAQWTNDRFAATQHRVVSRPTASAYSIPFFFHPDFDTEDRLPAELPERGRPAALRADDDRRAYHAAPAGGLCRLIRAPLRTGGR